MLQRVKSGLLGTTFIVFGIAFLYEASKWLTYENASAFVAAGVILTLAGLGIFVLDSVINTERKK